MTCTIEKPINITEIQILRAALIKFGMENGLNHPTTLKLSQELDKLLNEYMSNYFF